MLGITMYGYTEQSSGDCVVSDLLNIGVYIIPTNEVTLVPTGFFSKSDLKAIERTLNVPILDTMVGGTTLLGILAVANSNGLLLPSNLATEVEIENLRDQIDTNVGLIDSKITALGNVIVVNNNGAIVSPEFTKKDINTIEKILEVPVHKMRLAGLSIVGSLCVVTSRGALVSPLANDEEVELVSDILGVNTDICTVNRGYAFISTGLIANNNGALCGKDTTGIERARIIDILF